MLYEIFIMLHFFFAPRLYPFIHVFTLPFSLQRLGDDFTRIQWISTGAKTFVMTRNRGDLPRKRVAEQPGPMGNKVLHLCF
jgi:hypothetical protein